MNNQSNKSQKNDKSRNRINIGIDFGTAPDKVATTIVGKNGKTVYVNFSNKSKI